MSQLIENKGWRLFLIAKNMRSWRPLLFAGLVAFWAFFCQSASATSPLSQTFDANGVKIHYLLQGTGEPAVLTILIGNLDPVKKLYVDPLETVRKDWRVIEIPGAGHINYIFKREFINGIVEWVDMNRQK